MWITQKQKTFVVFGFKLDLINSLTPWIDFKRAFKLIKNYKGFQYKLQLAFV